jgi:hypothetical protein
MIIDEVIWRLIPTCPVKVCDITHLTQSNAAFLRCDRFAFRLPPASTVTFMVWHEA